MCPLQQVEELKRQRKLDSMSSYHFMLGLETQLKRGLGKSLTACRVPDSTIIRPLTFEEVRFRDPATGRMAIYDKATRKLTQARITSHDGATSFLAVALM